VFFNIIIYFQKIIMEKFDKNIFYKFKKKFNINENPAKNDLFLLEKTKKYIKYISFLPWLRFVWVWNSVWMNYSNKNSDIDLFIITTPNSLWFNRIIITFIFEILKVRKTHKKHAWMFCLSFFITTNRLDFKNIKIENDIYLYFWIIYLKPILDYNNTFDLFINSQSWCELNEYKNIILENKKYIKYKKNLKNPWIFVNFLDKVFKIIFIKKTIKNYEKLWKPYWIIIDDNILKFHNQDIRKKLFYKKFWQIIKDMV